MAFVSNPWEIELLPSGFILFYRGNEALPMEKKIKLLGSLLFPKGLVFFSCLFFVNPKGFEMNPEGKEPNTKGNFIKPKGNDSFFMKNKK